MNRLFWELIAISLLCLINLTTEGAENWPTGLSFVALTQGHWQLYLVTADASEPHPVTTVLEPRTPTYAPKTGKVAYIGADGSLREIVLASATEQVLLTPDKQRTFTQPAYDAEGKRLFVVVLKEGVSVDTDIAVLQGDQLLPVITQPLAQFEPRYQEPNTLYYATVHCNVGCGKIIQEIWRMDLVSGEADQLTLLNAIVRQPVVSKDGQWLYFAANKAGHFHLWRLALATGQYEPLTEGRVTDSNPALDPQGNLYFIRHSPAGVQLLRRQADGQLQALPLPATVEDLRDLEINP